MNMADYANDLLAGMAAAQIDDLRWYAECGQWQEWLADRAAQAEYTSWLDTLDTNRTQHATHKRNDPVKVSN